MDEKFIDITDVDMSLFVSKVYAASSPMGLGHLHFVPGDIPEDNLNQIMEYYKRNLAAAKASEEGEWAKSILHLDYVSGRCCKMNVFYKGGIVFIRGYWPDHSEFQFEEFLKEIGCEDQIPNINKKMYEEQRRWTR